MTTYFNGCAGGQSEPCVVIFRDEEVVIEYTRKGQPSTYRGHLKDGIYSLRYWPEADGFVGEATLCAPEGNCGMQIKSHPKLRKFLDCFERLRLGRR
ncbi:hypothetical protein R2K15_34175, partial [Pseudomonas aeruginosa]|uniref:hypothetical protein n=1 Tax=Pseudomonas aeruginosa TaxID=287 RepID=UPI00396F6F8F